MKHGEPAPLTTEQEAQLLLTDDPRLALVHADMTAWLEAHPCECEAGCDCEWTN